MRLTVGPLPPAVYWRRRVFVLGTLLLVIVLPVYACNGNDATGANTEDAGAATTSLGENSPGGQPDGDAKFTTSPQATGGSDSVSQTSTATSSPAAPDATFCTDEELRVTAVPSAQRMPVGTSTQIVLKIKNRSNRTCKRDVGADMQELYIVEQGTAAKIWSSDDCGGLRGSKIESFTPGFERAYTVNWNGRESTNCKDRLLPDAGEYQLYGRVGTKRSEPVTLTLT